MSRPANVVLCSVKSISIVYTTIPSIRVVLLSFFCVKSLYTVILCDLQMNVASSLYMHRLMTHLLLGFSQYRKCSFLVFNFFFKCYFVCDFPFSNITCIHVLHAYNMLWLISFQTLYYFLLKLAIQIYIIQLSDFLSVRIIVQWNLY